VAGNGYGGLPKRVLETWEEDLELKVDPNMKKSSI